MKLAKRLKKEKVNVDIINFGEEVRLLLCFWCKIQEFVSIPAWSLNWVREGVTGSLSRCKSDAERNVSLVSPRGSLNPFCPTGNRGGTRGNPSKAPAPPPFFQNKTF